MKSYQQFHATLRRAIDIRTQVEQARDIAVQTKKAPEGWTQETFAGKQAELVELLKQGQIIEANAREVESKLDLTAQDPVAETQKMED